MGSFILIFIEKRLAEYRLRQAVSDMDAIRADAWLLACMLAEADGQSVLAGLPGSQWN